MSKKKQFLKNVSMVVSSNLLILVLGVAISFVLPVFLSVEQYGYWQLYNYFIGFVGLFLFGFSDGMNLRYAGLPFHKLDRPLFIVFFRFICYFTGVLTVLALVLLNFFAKDTYLRIYLLISVNILLFNVNGYFIHLSQMTMRFREYSIANALERILFVLLFIPAFLMDITDFYYFIICNILCRVIAIGYNVHRYKELFTGVKVFGKISDYAEIKENYVAGFPITMATIFSMLMTTMPRFVMGQIMPIAVYGMFSFGTTSINLVIQIIAAMSSVFYPTLKTLSPQKVKETFPIASDLLTIFCAVSFLSYYAIFVIIELFFTKYMPVLDYLHWLFPTIMYQSINSFLIANFSRVLRLERKYFWSNLFFVMINCILTFVAAYLVGDVKIILLVSLLTMQFWIIHGNRFITSHFGIHSNMFLGVLCVVLFILCNELLNIGTSFVVYSSVLLMLTYLKLRDGKLIRQIRKA
ncbi:TPA: hypothetical protein TY296_000145 [Streptococcus suis]|nr:hypothetical protein [Streptococcus suis]